MRLCSTRHASACVIADSIFDIVYQYIELFFRSEKLQQICYQFARTLKKILQGGNFKDILYESASQLNMDVYMLLQMDDHEVIGMTQAGSRHSDILFQHMFSFSNSSYANT